MRISGPAALYLLSDKKQGARLAAEQQSASCEREGWLQASCACLQATPAFCWVHNTQTPNLCYHVRPASVQFFDAAILS